MLLLVTGRVGGVKVGIGTVIIIATTTITTLANNNTISIDQ